MGRTINWKEYKFRASQCHKLLTGDIVDASIYNDQINELENERDTLTNSNGNKVKWTTNKEEKLKKLKELASKPLFERLPKTMTTELRKIHRAEKHNRNFSFTNKYVQKGIQQEEEAITIYQYYRNKVLGIRTFFINNKERLQNEFVSGEADLTDTNDFEKCNEGFDTKCSWELETFPYKEDVLDSQYEIQNQVYMWLSNTEKWTTAYVLVNTTEDLLHKEKMKWYYALGLHHSNRTDKEQEELEVSYDEKCKELEIRFIFDYDKFVERNPMHNLIITREEWFDKGYNLDLEERVVEKISLRNNDIISKLKNRIEISRKYLEHLDNN